MKPSEILRRAAKIVASGKTDFGCLAIGYAAGWGNEALWQFLYRSKSATKATEWLDLFRPYDGSGVWWDTDDQGPRIIGLCLAAAIAESEGD